MNRPSSNLLRWIAIKLAAGPLAATAWQPGIPSGPTPVVPTSDFTVLTQNRNDVLAFWHAVYMASEGYETRIKWTGDYNGNPGSVSNEFAKDVERRLNFFRAMCGVSSNAHVNTGSKIFRDNADSFKPPAKTLKSTAAQASALMLIRNFNPNTGFDPAITHDAPASLVGWSKEAWNGNAHGNLAFGAFGPGAITDYIVEEVPNGSATSSWNSLAGHRRWALFPESTDFATGDQPGTSATRPPTNVLYIAQNNSEMASVTPDFVSYPPPGYFPAQVNSRYWSLSHSGADFSAASVQVTDSTGNSVPLSNVQFHTGYGHPALLWQVSGASASKSVYADTSFHVNVTGIAGVGVPTSFEYTVTLINPDRIVSNQKISGPASVVAGKSTIYQFTPPPMAEAVQIVASQRRSSPWTEGAGKTPVVPVIDHTAASYPLKMSMAAYGGFGTLSGPTAFHLTFPVAYDLIVRGVPEQSFELDRMILSRGDGKLKFLYRRGYMTKGSFLNVEASSNGGGSWSRIGKTIRGVNNAMYDSSVSTATFKLPKTKLPLRVRFRYYTKPGEPIYTHEATPTQPTGIFIDNITTKNCDWLDPKKATTFDPAAMRFSFKSSTAGALLVPGRKWSLALRTQLGGKWFPCGPLKTVKIAAP